ncbi:hypothetical protein HGRIS_011169 [Hohenbuehelia grisea]|uniref:Uncharacterized protein n=1 Tax=Hohenbuehelia grisea TaxID=104357 RepID=A0ABR3JW86_9AGAR
MLESTVSVSPPAFKFLFLTPACAFLVAVTSTRAPELPAGLLIPFLLSRCDSVRSSQELAVSASAYARWVLRVLALTLRDASVGSSLFEGEGGTDPEFQAHVAADEAGVRLLRGRRCWNQIELSMMFYSLCAVILPNNSPRVEHSGARLAELLTESAYRSSYITLVLHMRSTTLYWLASILVLTIKILDTIGGKGEVQ